MAFRPCIDLRNGRVVQIVGGTLTDDDTQTVTNHVSARAAADFAALYQHDGLRGGHVIMLGPGSGNAAKSALAAYPNGLQIGGGITADNAAAWFNSGASHVIVTSFLFDENNVFSPRRLEAMAKVAGKDRLVIDLSCRRAFDGSYYVATNRWQTVTETRLDAALFALLEPYCAEFLVHAADIEGKCVGIEEELVQRLGGWVSLPTTYAGGARRLEDIALVESLSGGKVDLTIGSALDIFGGSLVKYEEAARLGRR